MATHSSVLAWRIPWMEEPKGYSPWGRKESNMLVLQDQVPPSCDLFILGILIYNLELFLSFYLFTLSYLKFILFLFLSCIFWRKGPYMTHLFKLLLCSAHFLIVLGT